jgi:hypothetical protein
MATVPIHVSVSNLCIPLTGLPILLQENRWIESGNTVFRSLTDIGKLGLWPRTFLRIYKFTFLCSAISNVGRGLLYM